MQRTEEPQLELAPVEKRSPHVENPTPTQPIANANSSGIDGWFILVFAFGIVIFLLFLTGGATVFKMLTGINLMQKIASAPLTAATYAFLTTMSFLAAFEIRRIFADQTSAAIKRSYLLAIIIAGMISYAIFYSHLAHGVQLPEQPLITASIAIIGSAIGWQLPKLVDKEPLGTFAYLMALVILVGFTWLARLESIEAYGWTAFSTMITFFLRSAIDGLRNATHKNPPSSTTTT